MSLRDEMAGDMAGINADWPDSAIWKGTAYQCIVGELNAQINLEFAGTSDQLVLPVYITNSAWSNGLPKIGDILTICTKQYRINSLVEMPDWLTTLAQCQAVEQ